VKKNKEAEQIVKAKFIVLSPVLNELSRRRWAAAEARSLGYGGVSIVSRATGLSKTTITEGLVELSSKRQLTQTKVRNSGGGRKKISDEDRTVLAALEKLVDPMTRGDPMSPLRWTCKSTAKLASELNKQGHTISARTVARLLHDLDYSLQSNRKTKQGKQHPDRNAQFEFINKEAKKFQQRKQPVISVDTKKKENIGNYSNRGAEWHRIGKPTKTQTHDFPNKELGKGIPYGVYDPARNQGWVSVGIDHDTAYFATATINRWWQVMGKKAYPDAKELLITADSGGSNGSRTRLWKVALQKLANEIGLKISVCHYPPGTSKWNKIEHRMFCHITGNWRGHPLTSREVIVNLIANTTTTTGLSINAELDEASYATGIKISDKELSTVCITKNKFHGDWNYKISPNLSN
jgi:transposase